MICFCFSVSASVFIFPFFSPEAKAQSIGLEGATSELGGIAAGMGITVKDPGVTAGVDKNYLETATGWLMDRARENWRDMLFNASALAFKSGLRFFLNELAYNSAVYLATGDKGQTPMFYTDSWKDYLIMAADGAAGMFLDKMVTNIGSATGWWQNFSICDPNINVKIMIALGLRRQMYERPRCTFSQLTENWESKLSSPTFLNDFQNMFNPWESDMGIALTMQAGSVDYAQKAKENATYQRLTNDFKPITEKISGFIKSPSRATMKAFDKPIDDSDAPEKIFTGSMAADAIDIFISTLIGKLFEQWLMSGLVSEVPSTVDLSNPEIEALNDDIEAAKERFRKLIEPQFGTRGDYDILVDLTSCPDPSKPGPTDCVITEKFRQAVANRLTVKAAMDQGYLNKNGVFGFIAGKSLEPKFENGDYPYRSLVILRKYRIIPVGWEIGAQYIKMDNPQGGNDQGKNITLKEMAECFEADDNVEGYEEPWCRGLVDPNWVLKAPLNYCKKLGYGPEIISKSITGDGDSSKTNISRNGDYCADEQSCVKENFDGSCQVYGYCSEERRTWNFNNRSCDPKYNTCEIFRSRSGNTASYLENTLDYNGCTADNVGCLGYCKTENYVPGVKNTSFVIEQDYDAGGGKIRTRKWELPATFQNNQTAAEFYGYRDAHSLMDNQWIVKADRSEFFIHYNTVTGISSIGWLHDKPQLVKCQAYIKHPEDPYDSQSENDWCVDSANPGACGNGENWQTADPSANCFDFVEYCKTHEDDRSDEVNCDGGEAALAFSKITAGNKVAVRDDAGDANNSGIGNEIKQGDNWEEGWTKKNTDGGMIEMPSGNWEVEIAPTLTAGISELVFAYEGGMLDASQGFKVVLGGSNLPFRIKSSPDTLSGEWQCEGAKDKIYFDKDAEKCDSGNEGCHEFIRTKAGIGANLLINSGFEDYLDIGGWDKWGKADSDRRSGSSALALKDGGVSKDDVSPGPWEVGEYFTLSLYAKNCAGLKAKLGDAESETGLSGSSDWQRLILSAKMDGTGIEIAIGLKEYAAGCVIDDIKLERNDSASDWNEYGGPGKIYEKLIPAYFENSAENENRSHCYEDVNPDDGDGLDYTFSKDALPECSNFARKCNPDEANCELYTSIRTKEAIPAKISANDLCPSTCVGYDMFIQKETGFDSARPEYFIPKTARTCGYVSAGCDEFTNLDELEKGAEKKEYYSELRQCIKPAEAGSPGCNDFYTWEGSSETGFQLKVFRLKQDDDGEAGDLYSGDPAITGDDSDNCGETSYADGTGGSDCRQFYNRQGGISYHLYLKTISCSDDCHPYRRTENNTLDSEARCKEECPDSNQACACSTDCGAATGKLSCKKSNTEYIYCKNGGTWRNDHNACVYSAIPGEGRACSASQAGCREYNGNNGANVRTIFSDNFEDGTGDWTANKGTLEISGEAVFVGEHSLKATVSGTEVELVKPVGTLLADDDESSYILTFTAKKLKGGSGGQWIVDNGIYFSDGTDKSYFEIDEETKAGLAGDGDWLLYKFNLKKLDHAETDKEILVIKANQGYYIDNIKLTQTIDRYYLIKNSWNTPLECDNKIDDPEGQKAYASGSAGCKTALPDSDGTVRACFPQEMLNCDQYKDREKIDYYLKSFSALCQDSAVGCELMVDTHNSTNPEAMSYEDGEISVPADNFIYAVYDKKKTCNAADKGCERLGKPYSYSGDSVYQNEFLKNDPDAYPKILCSSSEEGCEEWIATESDKNYFKDPGDQVCEYRQALGLGAGWWKKQVKRCDDGSGVGSSVNGKIDAEINAEGNSVKASENQICVDTGGCGRTGIKCDSDEVCGAFRTCLEGECRYTCILDANNYGCQTDAKKAPKTIGYPGAPIEQPDEEEIKDVNDIDRDGNTDEIIKTIKWAGACPASEAGCSEYIDPVSRFLTNVVFNSDFSQNVDNANGPDGWNCDAREEDCSQELQLSPSALYIISGENLAGGNVSLKEKAAAAKDIHELIEGAGSGGANYFKDGENSISLDLSGNIRKSKRFYVSGNDITNGTLSVKGKADNSTLEIKEAAISYQLKRNIDKTSCNGLVNFDNGCVLFNERTYAGAGWAGLTLNADSSKDGEAPKTDSPVNANVLIKVAPDRVCNEWLACRSAVGLGIKNASNSEEQACFNIGTCNQMDDSGKCVSFSISDDESAMEAKGIKGALSNVSEFANRSGYSKVGIKTVDDPGMKGYFAFGDMNQIGEVSTVPNGNFEIYGSNKYPIGWSPQKGSWNMNLFSAINNPYAAQAEGGISGRGGIGYPVEGVSLLKYSAAIHPKVGPTSEYIDVERGEYVLSARINTLGLKSVDSATVRAVVGLEFFNSQGNSLASSLEPINMDMAGDWKLNVAKFKVSGSAKRIKLNLTSKIGNDYCQSAVDPVLRLSDGVSNIDCNEGAWMTVGPEDNGEIQSDSSGPEIKIRSDNQTPSDCATEKWKAEIQDASGGWHEVYSGDSCNLENGSNFLINMEDFGLSSIKNVRATCTGTGSDECVSCPDISDWHFISLAPAYNISNSKCSGNIYIDDIKIKPALAARPEWNITQSCRLYPQSDSLSCDYFNDSGLREKGLYGYCLQYDRSPGSPENCLQWWPVDKVKGDGIEEGAGYQGRYPLYYTTDIEDISHCSSYELVGVKKNQVFTTPAMHCDSFGDECDDDRVEVIFDAVRMEKRLNPGPFPGFTFSCSEDGVNMQYTGAGLNPVYSDSTYDWFCTSDSFVPELIEINAPCGAEAIFDPGPRKPWYKFIATKIIQVVTPSGQNKYWSGRVYNGSTFNYSCNAGLPDGLLPDPNYRNCEYGYDYPPFGSLVYPYPSANPYEWDGKGDLGIQPLYYELPDTENYSAPYQPRTGQLSTEDNIKNLFAQSYGNWQWDGSNYVPYNSSCVGGSNDKKVCIIDADCPGGACTGNNWTSPGIVCPTVSGEILRPEFNSAAPSADLCAVPPLIYNIKVNATSTVDVEIIKNGYVNFTFNSHIDSQQLPLTMISVDWGDLENTIITGVEMRDRQDPVNPHSLYHLYDYWDLKRKAADTSPRGLDVSDIDCPAGGNFCLVRPRIKIMDNWGWCTSGTTGDNCPSNGYIEFSHWIVVKER